MEFFINIKTIISIYKVSSNKNIKKIEATNKFLVILSLKNLFWYINKLYNALVFK